MQRVMVVGPCGAGKSTVARRLGKILDAPTFHMDVLGWQDGWVETPPEELSAAVEQVLAENERWVFDGNDSATMPQRLRLADTVVYLDFPLILCAWRVLLRIWSLRGSTRPDMAPGCPEQFNLEFLVYVLRWNKGPRQKNAAALAGHENKIIMLTSPSALEAWLNAIQV